ncbi:MAG: amino acid ABC transporter substrate-binding protein, partial [Clostridia bacterium]|nr:amino acid ABC transporter substrate-binding protein [Clostridia bacterium]
EILKGFDATTKIGYQNGTTAQFYVLGDAEWEFDGFAVEGKGYDNGALAVQDLINGNINYVIIDAAPATMIAANFNALS